MVISAAAAAIVRFPVLVLKVMPFPSTTPIGGAV
jgi:hypothetical protein